MAVYSGATTPSVNYNGNLRSNFESTFQLNINLDLVKNSASYSTTKLIVSICTVKDQVKSIRYSTHMCLLSNALHDSMGAH